MDKRYNIYWTETDGKSYCNRNMFGAGTMILVEAILATGGEITGIIDSEKD